MIRLLSLLVAFLILSCSTEKAKEATSLPAAYTAEEGFDLAGSDPAALQLADSVMSALGGKANWDKIRYITWKTDDATNYWDKQEKRARVESVDGTVYLINLSTGSIEASAEASAEKNAQVSAAFSRALYALALPFLTKSKDFSLQYMGEDTLAKQRYNSLVISQRDSTAGKYKLFVDKHNKLVRFWAFQPAASNVAAFVLPFDNYQQQSEVLLSGDRSSGSGPKDVKVETALPDKLFTSF